MDKVLENVRDTSRSSYTTQVNNINSYPPSITSNLPNDNISSQYSIDEDQINKSTPNNQYHARDNLIKLSLLNNSSKKSSQPSSLNLNLGFNLNLIPSNKNNSNNKSNTGIGKDYWLDDASAIKCRSCDKKFTTFLRKHHCRICGKIFCSNCTTFIDGSKFNHNGKMRVCLLCHNLADRYDDEDFSSDDEIDEVFDNNNTNNDITITNDNNLDALTLDNLTPAPMMTIPTTRAGEAVEIDIPKYKPSNNSASKLSKIDKNNSNKINNDNNNTNDYSLPKEKNEDSSDDENEMISFMNNHQFSWPKTSRNSNSNSSSENPALNLVLDNPANKNPVEHDSNPHFLTKVNPFKSNSTISLNQSFTGNKSSRRRHFSNRFKTRTPSRGNINTKITHLSSANIQFSDDFQKIGEKYAKSLLTELLIDKKILNFDEWSGVLMASLKKINSLEIDLKNITNTNLDPVYNFANFIKIKKILGTNLHETKSVEGIIFSKKLPLNSMPTSITNPKIMLITFPIEYDQDINNKHHYQSLESIIAQQNQYIKKLADRISNLKPNIILSSKPINGIALDLFADLNISVVPSCKLNNLIKLSKFTKSTIITSIDLLAMKPQLGTCESFNVLNYKFENTVKTYLFFNGCPNKIGLTIILRDSSDETLTKIKSCLMIMIYTFTNMKLESSFMRDQCLKVEDNNELEFLQNPESLDSLYSHQVKNFDDFVYLVNTRLVSTSPWVKFDQPLILKQLEFAKFKIEDNQSIYEQFISSSLEEKYKFKEHYNIQDLEIVNEDDLLKLIEEIKKFQDNHWKIEMSFYMRKWEQFWRSRELTFFDPNYNQNIVVLFSMISKKNSTPCLGPEIQMIDFYWENDFSLGQFIENMCVNANTLCNESCELPLKDHYRSYVHNNGKIDIFLESNNLNASSSNIMTWGVCKKCFNITPVLPLNDTSYKYSFGKFLELIFWFNTSFDFKILNNNSSCQCKVNNNKFNFFKDYIHYFSYKNYKIHLEYSEIDNLKLVVPKFQLFWNPIYDYKIRLDHYNSIKSKCQMFFESVDNRLKRIKLDGTNLKTELVNDGNKKLIELKDKLIVQMNEINLLLNALYDGSKINEHLKLNLVLREVQELSSYWNMEFQSFAKIYLPSEKDVKKITAFQLDKLFKSLVNKEESDEAESNDTNFETDQQNEIKDEVSDRIERGEEEANFTNEEPGSPKKRKSQLILNRIHELNNKKSDDLLWIPPTKMSGEGFDEGKVKQLTKFFDTQEYFNQRELERKKMDKFNNYTPKVTMMKPKIEIYKTTTDAVNANKYKSLKSQPSKSNEFTENTPEKDFKEEKPNDKDKDKDKEGKDKDKDDVQPEKVSLLKSLTHFWADRSATLWEPLKYPLSSSEHIFIDSDVIIREDEPSSIIAFCLSTSDYKTKLTNKGNNTNSDDNNKEQPNPEDGTIESVVEDEGNIATGKGDETNVNEKTVEQETDLESIMLKNGFHLYYEFEEGYSTISCKLFFAQQFDALRRQCGVNDNFVESLSRCIKWDSTGGKSGSAFLKTLDQRFIIKELSKSELEAFLHFAPTYFEYFSQVLFHDLPSVLVKIFGFYQIQVKNTLPNAKSYTIDILIMENLFYDRKIDRIFDLKGSMRNRHVEQTGKENEVLLDENMVEYIYESPLFVKENDKRLLRNSLFNDTLFLEKMNVMDYSLVVGIDLANDELVVGIIDCIRTFTWDKKLESWVKEKGLVGNTGIGKEPTVITPKQYKNRFREAMERYILMAPGVYYQGTTNST